MKKKYFGTDGIRGTVNIGNRRWTRGLHFRMLLVLLLRMNSFASIVMLDFMRLSDMCKWVKVDLLGRRWNRTWRHNIEARFMAVTDMQKTVADEFGVISDERVHAYAIAARSFFTAFTISPMFLCKQFSILYLSESESRKMWNCWQLCFYDLQGWP